MAFLRCPRIKAWGTQLNICSPVEVKPIYTFEKLYPIAQKHLEIFDNPAYSHLDTPNWVSRVTSHTAMQPVFKFFMVRNLIRVMFNVAEDLKLDRGKREAQEARGGYTTSGFDLGRFLALAIATPTKSKTASLIDIGLNKSRKSNLQDGVLRRDGYRCILTGNLDNRHWQETSPEASRLHSLLSAMVLEAKDEDEEDEAKLTEKLEVAHIFKRALAVYSSASQTGTQKFHSAAITFELLSHYCQLDSKYIEDAEKPNNAISLTDFYHSRFDAYISKRGYRNMPTEIPHCYEVKNYHKLFNHMKKNKIPSRVTLKDHSQADSESDAACDPPEAGSSTSHPQRPEKRRHEAMGIDLPDPELLQLHAALTGVLRLSGAAEVFDDIKERRGPGNPPVPSADGAAFFKDVVDVVPDIHDLREAVAQMWPTSS
ncbi:hypothetical protein LXA43DRAFT_1101650 [Ganoderma leucocontextum]|nr:hypothetical protein LXA43DRAFT_1101650 [Ganoderma leucocontextum]